MLIRDVRYTHNMPQSSIYLTIAITNELMMPLCFDAFDCLLLQLGITLSIPTAQEAGDEVVGRLSYLFSDTVCIFRRFGVFRTVLI